MRRFTVGLTGGIGSGKSTVAKRFEEHGVAVIDADALSHALTAPGGAAINAIAATFGSTFIGADGSMDRAQMRARVFAEPGDRRKLEAILHPLVHAETSRQAATAASPYIILMIPLLIEARTRNPQWRERFDRILVIDCSEATQIARVMQRSALTPDAVRAIMAAQATRAERLAHADDVIDNDGPAAAITPQADALHHRYLALAGHPPAASYSSLPKA